MKHIFVFIGEGMTGKSILGNICNSHQDTRVYDDVDLRNDKEIKNIIVDIGNRGFDNYIIIVNNEELLNHLTDRLMLLINDKEAIVSVCNFEQLKERE